MTAYWVQILKDVNQKMVTKKKFVTKQKIPVSKVKKMTRTIIRRVIKNYKIFDHHKLTEE